MNVAEQVLTSSVKTLNCKTTASAYAVFDDNRKFIEMKQRPNICGVPHCKKCAKERQDRLIHTYKPYFDAYQKKDIRHIICTTPVVKRSELANALSTYMENIKRFHEKIRKTFKYPLQAIMVIEAHSQGDTYNLHSHYGIFTHINIGDFRKAWCAVWNNDNLIVKYPQRGTRPVYRTNKYAFMEYATRRRIEQPFQVELTDYYAHIRHRQLLKRIGFNKVYLAKVTTLRKEQKKLNGLPDNYTEYFLGNYDITYKFTEIEAHFRRRLAMCPDPENEMISFRSHVAQIFRSVLENDSSIKPQLEQITLNKIAVQIKTCLNVQFS